MKSLKQKLILLSGSIILFFSCNENKIQNPILPGFYPDPSICRVGEDYYLVNSSFSYFPGVPVFHSKDLINWEQIGHILDRPSQLNLTNQAISQGIYAPTIRYNNGVFYMITTLVGGGGNFFVTTENPAGPWSDPNWLNEIDGIDPSFFFDEDGKAYIVNNGPPTDNISLYEGHRALWLQEFDLTSQKLTGERKIIVNAGTDISKKPIWIEGPHLFKRNGYYYLLAAEGGTESGHSEVIFRSRSVWGPYEGYSGNPILTQRDLPADRISPVTCAGHADMVQTSDGDWVSVFLACQPYSGEYFNTGRQTFFNLVDWSGEWPVILEKGLTIPETVNSPLKAVPEKITFTEYSSDWRDDFGEPSLKMEWNFIRTPLEKWYELSGNSLVINARQTRISEVGNPSFIGRRLQHANAEFTASVKLEESKEMEAGLVAFQNEKFFYKIVLLQSSGKHYLTISSAMDELINIELQEFNAGNEIFLKIISLGNEFKCEYSLDNVEWLPCGEILDGKILSTKIAGGFVGAYFGLFAYSDSSAKATFDWATYKKIVK